MSRSHKQDGEGTLRKLPGSRGGRWQGAWVELGFGNGTGQEREEQNG